MQAVGWSACLLLLAACCAAIWRRPLLLLASGHLHLPHEVAAQGGVGAPGLGNLVHLCWRGQLLHSARGWVYGFMQRRSGGRRRQQWRVAAAGQAHQAKGRQSCTAGQQLQATSPSQPPQPLHLEAVELLHAAPHTQVSCWHNVGAACRWGGGQQEGGRARARERHKVGRGYCRAAGQGLQNHVEALLRLSPAQPHTPRLSTAPTALLPLQLHTPAAAPHPGGTWHASGTSRRRCL